MPDTSNTCCYNNSSVLFLVRLRALSKAYEDGFTECLNTTIGFLVDSGSHATLYEAEIIKNCLLQELQQNQRCTNPVPSHRRGGGEGGGTGVNSAGTPIVVTPRPVIPAFTSQMTLSSVDATVNSSLGVTLEPQMSRHGTNLCREFLATNSRFLPYARPSPLRERNQNLNHEEGKKPSSSKTAPSTVVGGNGQSTFRGKEVLRALLSPANLIAEKQRQVTKGNTTTALDRNCSTKDEDLWRPF